MDKKAIFKLCKDQGCCDACAVRFLGVKHPNAYENLKNHVKQYQEAQNSEANTDSKDSNKTVDQHQNPDKTQLDNNTENSHKNENGSNVANDSNGPPLCKRRKTEACVCCLGVLEEETWPECNEMVKEVLDKKGYDCQTFACALSSPISTLLREKVVTLKIRDAFPDYDVNIITPLKETWKWLYGSTLARHINKTQDSGAICPLLVTVSFEYPNEANELELLKTISPDLFESRSKQKRRFAIEFTRRSAEQALEGPVEKIRKVGEELTSALRARCVSVSCSRDPIYIGGRYVKLSRTLPQTPWLVGGKRMMESSVQEVIFEPLAKILGIPSKEIEHRLKFMSAGREDVDVRCLGEGRPFAVEVSDPRRLPIAEQLSEVSEEVSKSGIVTVHRLCIVSKDELAVLKQGEESKHKTYEALCIKLSHSKHETEKSETDPIEVTHTDIANISAHAVPLTLTQRSPIRVLHRRSLLARNREILSLHGETVAGYPQLFTLRIETSAGTYVKEWVHGELGRTRPSLCDVIGAKVDILALDVTAVHLDWPARR